MRTRIVFLAVALLVPLTMVACGDDSTSPPAGAFTTSFARMMGSTPDDVTTAGGVVVLSDGSRLVVGRFSGELHVTGYPDSLSSGGTTRIFYTAFRPDGSRSMFNSVGGGTSPAIVQIARDADDNVLLVGYFTGNINFDGHNLTSAGGIDVFFAKTDKNGNAIWVQAGAATGDDSGWDIAADGAGSIYMTGVASGEMAVAGEDVGEIGSSAGFVVKIQPGGVGNWSQTAAGTGISICTSVAPSADGSVVVCGLYAQSTTFFAGDTLPFDGTTDGFVGRLDANGQSMGTIHIGGTGSASPQKVMTLNNDAIVTGMFNGTVDFDVNSAAGAVTASGGTNAFLARYSEAGALRWVKTFGPGDDQVGLSLARLDGNHILMCGSFSVSITLGSTTLTPVGMSDLFIARLDGDGNVVSASRVGGTDTEDSVWATTSGSAAIIVGLTSSDDVLFPGGIHRTRIGHFDSFIYQQP